MDLRATPKPQPTSSPEASTPAASRPHLADYLLILVGCGLSLLLVEWSGLRAVLPSPNPSPLVQSGLRILPALLFLPVGIVLFWPVFYPLSRLYGRDPHLTLAEWLWGFAWLGSLILGTWFVWKGLGTPPEFLAGADFKHAVLLGYLIFALTLALLALLVWIVDLVKRWPRPWTHSFALALQIWPAIPLACLWLARITLE